MLLTKSYTINKKVIIIFILFFMPHNFFAQSVRTGGYGITQFPIGEAANYFLNAFGGGVSLEFGFSEKFGESLHIQYMSVVPNNDRILSSWQLTTFIGIWYNIPLTTFGVFIQPAIDIGLIYEGSEIKQGYGVLSQRAFADLELQFCPSLRFKHEKLLNNHIEIELTPMLSLIPQQVIGLSFIGLRLGVLYVFDFK